MKDYIVRFVGKQWYKRDYVGTYSAASAIAAIIMAGRDPYIHTLNGQTRYSVLSAVEA